MQNKHMQNKQMQNKQMQAKQMTPELEVQETLKMIKMRRKELLQM